jgi:hypothetical protein
MAEKNQNKDARVESPEDVRTQQKVIESLVLRGDLSGLAPGERARHYVQMCESLGLNPNAQPFAFLRLNGKEVLYATRGATDQLAAIHRINREVIDGPKVIDLAGHQAGLRRVPGLAPQRPGRDRRGHGAPAGPAERADEGRDEVQAPGDAVDPGPRAARRDGAGDHPRQRAGARRRRGFLAVSSQRWTPSRRTAREGRRGRVGPFTRRGPRAARGVLRADQRHRAPRRGRGGVDEAPRETSRPSPAPTARTAWKALCRRTEEVGR